MPYVRRNWQNAPSSATPLNAAALNNIEDGVEEAVEAVTGRLSEATLETTFGSVAASVSGIRVNPLEGVAFYNYGDSYGDGSQGADQASRPFNRLALRHRTAAITLRAQAGKRMDEIAQRVFDTWTPNSRGLIGFSDGVINDLKQYGNDASRVTTREAFRSCLAMLTAKAISGTGSSAIAFDASWSGGITSTANAQANVAVTAPKVYLLVGFYDTEGGTLTIKQGATTLATVNTNGYARDFIGAVPISGLTGTSELAVIATSGTARLYGVAIPSAYPPVIVWDKPGRYSSNNTEATRLALYLSECASILADFPSVLPVDIGDAGWDYTTMIDPVDNTHRNDYGNLYATDKIDTALSAFLGGQPRQGLNRLLLGNTNTGADVTYVTPTATPLIVITTYAADDFNRANGAPGNTPTGGFAWTLINAGVWTISSNALASSNGATTAPNDCYIDDGQSNGTITATFGTTNSPGILFRALGTNNANGYIVWISGGTLTLSKRTAANSYTALGTGGSITAGTVVKVVMNGSNIRVLKAGVEVINVTDASYAGTRHGFWTNGTSPGGNAGTFEDFSHTDQVA